MVLADHSTAAPEAPLEVSDSLLSKHMSHLEEAGYVQVIKGYHGKRPRTWYSLSGTGRQAFDNLGLKGLALPLS